MGGQIKLSDELLKEAEKILNGKIDQNTLGVFVRGTDYIATRPKGHFIQPSAEEIVEKINDLSQEGDVKKVFLVTEDYNIEQYVKKYSFIPVITVSQDIFQKYDYKNPQYLSKYIFPEDVYYNTILYLSKCIGLSRCEYMLASIASGSIFANFIKDKPYKKVLYLDKGKY